MSGIKCVNQFPYGDGRGWYPLASYYSLGSCTSAELECRSNTHIRDQVQYQGEVTIVTTGSDGKEWTAFAAQPELEPHGVQLRSWHGSLVPESTLRLWRSTVLVWHPLLEQTVFPDGGMIDITSGADFYRNYYRPGSGSRRCVFRKKRESPGKSWKRKRLQRHSDGTAPCRESMSHLVVSQLGIWDKSGSTSMARGATATGVAAQRKLQLISIGSGEDRRIVGNKIRIRGRQHILLNLINIVGAVHTLVEYARELRGPMHRYPECDVSVQSRLYPEKAPPTTVERGPRADGPYGVNARGEISSSTINSLRRRRRQSTQSATTTVPSTTNPPTTPPTMGPVLTDDGFEVGADALLSAESYGREHLSWLSKIYLLLNFVTFLIDRRRNQGVPTGRCRDTASEGGRPPRPLISLFGPKFQLLQKRV
ncbi:hypothetical protein GGX14DRAFT_595137 [Mycena pura]|uniref:Uncharacterized protein n=1 Tax=Mycena pura TaxID=153505 RepID=A0AAD6VNT6_9AGAR|nr:hypothetical protein GGX14DRAFT_595137 [Mycena pura]